ncbi:MAG: undecaprenyl-diphosphate phosphatase, partial [Acidimicrobiia bacterium]
MLQDIVLGLVQGLTEFLPISSSGHLVIVPAMFGWDQPELGLTVLLHLGTLVALVVYFRRDLLGLLNGVLGRGPNPDANRRIAFLLVLASVPAAVAGLAFGSFFEATFERPYQTCAELLLTAFILLACEHLGDRATRRSIDAPRATGIGVAQAAAILPGISRSGATIGAGLWFGMSREEATRFSFLLSIPAIFGAGVLD